MSPATIALLVQFSLQYGIPAAIKVAELFQKKDATVDDVIVAFKLAKKPYDQYENLPEGSPIQPLPPA